MIRFYLVNLIADYQIIIGALYITPDSTLPLLVSTARPTSLVCTLSLKDSLCVTPEHSNWIPSSKIDLFFLSSETLFFDKIMCNPSLCIFRPVSTANLSQWSAPCCLINFKSTTFASPSAHAGHAVWFLNVAEHRQPPAQVCVGKVNSLSTSYISGPGFRQSPTRTRNVRLWRKRRRYG